MASPSADSDIEAQINSVSETQPPTNINPPPTTDTATPQLPSSAVPQAQAQATNTDHHHNRNPPTQESNGISQAQRGMLTFLSHARL